MLYGLVYIPSQGDLISPCKKQRESDTMLMNQTWMRLRQMNEYPCVRYTCRFPIGQARRARSNSLSLFDVSCDDDRLCEAAASHPMGQDQPGIQRFRRDRPLIAARANLPTHDHVSKTVPICVSAYRPHRLSPNTRLQRREGLPHP